MPIFTTEIAGKPTVAFAAPDYASALNFVDMDFLRSELMDLRAMDGASLWDGQAKLVVWVANEKEKSAWEADVANEKEKSAWEADVAVAIREGEIDRREDALDSGWFIFLVPYLETDE